MIRRIVASSRSHGWSLTYITLAKAVVGMVTFKEHTDFVQHALFSSDGGMQCSGGLDGMVFTVSASQSRRSVTIYFLLVDLELYRIRI